VTTHMSTRNGIIPKHLSAMKTQNQIIVSMFFFVAPLLSLGQSDPQMAIITNARTSFARKLPSEVTLRGTVVIGTAPRAPSGTVRLVADDNNSNKAFFDLTTGKTSEEQWDDSSRRRCQFTAGEKIDSRLGPNCWLSVSWFLPQMSLAETPSKHLVRELVGRANEEGRDYYVVNTQRSPDVLFRNASERAQATEWSKMRLRLDPSTMLPESLSYVIFENNRVDLKNSVKVLYSDYFLDSGLMVPHRIRRFINNGLQSDIHIDTVTVK
jgi:hypothetical protein